MGERCGWCGTDPLYVAYHDTEWGVPERDARALWEKLMLDGFQAGLAWITILRKRDGFRAAFAGFDPEVIAGWGEADVARLLADPGIVRHRGKIEATIGNARAYLRIAEREGFDHFLWGTSTAARCRTASRRCPRCRPRPPFATHLEGSEGRRLPLLRADDRLRVHAGHRHGERPPRDLSLPRTGRAAWRMTSSGGLLPIQRLDR